MATILIHSYFAYLIPSFQKFLEKITSSVLLSFVLFMKVANISVYSWERMCRELFNLAASECWPEPRRAGDSRGAQPFKYSTIHRLLHGHFQVNLAVQHFACRRQGNSINFNGWSDHCRHRSTAQSLSLQPLKEVRSL